jgi:hypothetical protein
MLPGLCAAQANQFLNLPLVQMTAGRVSSFLPGMLQSPASLTDLLWVNAAVGSGVTSSVTVGEELNQGGGFFNGGENHIVFTSVANVAAALADFDGDGKTDFAFALTPAVAGTTNLCVYYGSGATVAQAEAGVSSYAGPASSPANAYPPIGGKNGCMTFATTGSKAPYFSQIVAFPLKTASPLPGLLIEDSANNLVYIFSNTGFDGVNGALAGFKLIGTITLASADGTGPISIGDFNSDGNTDFIVNGQAGNAATVYLGNGDGTFSATPIRYTFDHHVHSLLLHDMNHDGIQDMVVEGDGGVIEIFPGTGATANPFSMTNIGGTIGIGSPVGIPDGFSGTGGHLAVIDPNTLDILTTTPIGLSVLQPLTGGPFYQLKAIYNIGPGRTSFALADLYDTGLLDLAVDSAEGVAIFRADTNRDGGFQASNAYAALAPALGSVVGRFRNTASNPNGYLDVVVNTGATQAQLLTGIGGGTFNTFPGVVDTGSGPANVPANVWSNILTGDFDGDGNLDIMYTLTGLPQPGVSGTVPLRYTQYGNGDGTFDPSGFDYKVSGVTFSNSDGLFEESAVGDFNGDGVSDVAASNAFDDTLELSGKGIRDAIGVSFINPDSSNANFSQVAAGFFKLNRANQQDVVYEQGASFIPYVNKQTGSLPAFTEMPALTGAGPPLYPSTVLLTDVDRDGNGDLVVVYYNSEYNSVGAGPVAPNDLYIWWGNGDGTFSATPLVVTLSRNDYLGTVADMNGDGLPDLVLSDGSLVTILYNQGAVSTPPNRTFAGEQHFLAGQGINSLSLLPLAGNSSPSLVVANGGATISNALALGGGTASSLSLTPNPDVNTGGITVLINNITTQQVTGSLTASPDPSPFGDAFTLTAILTPSPGGAAPTGTVQFSIDGANVGAPVTVVPGTGSSTATYVVAAGNTYAGGLHTLTAVYSGDSANSPVTLAGTEDIAGGATTSTILMCIGPTAACPAPPGVPNPFPPYSPSLTMYYGQIWNGYIEAAANDGSTLTGNLELIDTYTGAAAPPPNPLCTLVLGVTPACPNSVGTTQGTSVGLNLLTGYYPGDATHTGSTSNPTAITVLQDLTSQPALTGAPNPSPAGDPVTFTATLTGNFAAPTGTVTFSQVGVATPIGTGTFAPGSGFTSSATFTTSSLPIGNDSITASYAATTDFAGATFPTIVETITPSLNGNFTLTATPNPVTIGVGYGAILTVTVTPQNAFSQGVNLTCSNLPAEATCTFLNPSIAAGGGSTSLVVQTTSPHTCGTTTPYFYGSAGKGPLAPFALPALAGLVLLFVPGKRRWLRALLAVAAVAAIAQISGCSTCTDLGTRPATYTFQVTGTAANSPTTQSQPVTMTVTI